MILYAIHHKPTGDYILEYQKKQRGGYSYSEPEPLTSGRFPHFFVSEHAARSFLGSWLRGIHHKKQSGGHRYDYDGFLEDVEQWVEIEKIPTRIKEEMELIKFYCLEESEAKYHIPHLCA